MRPVKSKADFVTRYQEGEFGNRAPTWPDVETFLEEYQVEWPPDEQRFHLRSRDPGGPTFYDLSYYEIVKGAIIDDTTNFYVSAMAPTERTLLQGELRRAVDGLELHYTTVPLPMRKALAKCSHTVIRETAKMLVRNAADAESYDWIFNHLMEEYPDHIIEFSCYSVNWGTVPNRNTVIWEVRPDRGFGLSLTRYTEIY